MRRTRDVLVELSKIPRRAWLEINMSLNLTGEKSNNKVITWVGDGDSSVPAN